jgi:hypothetical protein
MEPPFTAGDGTLLASSATGSTPSHILRGSSGRDQKSHRAGAEPVREHTRAIPDLPRLGDSKSAAAARAKPRVHRVFHLARCDRIACHAEGVAANPIEAVEERENDCCQRGDACGRADPRPRRSVASLSLVPAALSPLVLPAAAIVLPLLMTALPAPRGEMPVRTSFLDMMLPAIRYPVVTGTRRHPVPGSPNVPPIVPRPISGRPHETGSRRKNLLDLRRRRSHVDAEVEIHLGSTRSGSNAERDHDRGERCPR